VVHLCGAEWIEVLRPPARLRAGILDELQTRTGGGNGFTLFVGDRAVRIDVTLAVAGDLVHLVIDPTPPN